MLKVAQGAEILPSPVVRVEREEVTLAPVRAMLGRSVDCTNTSTLATSVLVSAATATAAAAAASGEGDGEPMLLNLFSHFFTHV